ncbi:hypothetical protein FQZ97_917240 [compost metagenome]
MVQDHVQHHAIGGRLLVIQGIGEPEFDVAEAFRVAAHPRQLQHRHAVVQRGDLGKAPGQVRQETAVAGADFQRRGAGGKAQGIEQCQDTLTVLRQSCDQVLLCLEFFRRAGEEVAADRFALGVHLGYPRTDLGRQLEFVDLGQQRRVQGAADPLVLRQGAAIEDRIALTPGGHQARLGQYLEVMAHARLAGGEDLRQFQYAEGVVGQHPQHVQPQRIAAGLAQGGQLVAVVMTDLGYAQAHRGRSLAPVPRGRNANIKKF